VEFMSRLCIARGFEMPLAPRGSPRSEADAAPDRGWSRGQDCRVWGSPRRGRGGRAVQWPRMPVRNDNSITSPWERQRRSSYAQLDDEDDRAKTRQGIRRTLAIGHRGGKPYGLVTVNGPNVPEHSRDHSLEDRVQRNARRNHLGPRNLWAERFVLTRRRDDRVGRVIFVHHVIRRIDAGGQARAAWRFQARELNAALARSVCAPNTHRCEQHLPEAKGHETEERDQAMSQWLVHWGSDGQYTGFAPESSRIDYRSLRALIWTTISTKSVCWWPVQPKDLLRAELRTAEFTGSPSASIGRCHSQRKAYPSAATRPHCSGYGRVRSRDQCER